MFRHFKKVLVVTMAFLALATLAWRITPALEATAEEKAKKQSDFIGTTKEVALTENYSLSNAGLSLDSGKSGILISSEKTGDEAESSGFRFSGTFLGEFSLDFRIFSEKTYGENVNRNGENIYRPGTPTTLGAQFGEDELNPYQDVKQVTFTFTDKQTGKNFTLYLTGGACYWSTLTRAAVTTGTMQTPVGKKYTDMTYAKFQSYSKDYNTLLHGTSFSNMGNSYSNNTPDADGGISSQIAFDPMTMQVFAYGRTNQGVVTKLEVLDLSNPEHVGTNNVIEKNSFGEYTVDVKFTDLTSDNFTQSYTRADTGETYTLEPYERRANMIIYSLNGQDLGYDVDGKINDMVAPKIVLRTKQAVAGKLTKLDIITSDVFDGEKEYKGKIRYCTSYDSIKRTLLFNDGYYLNLPRAGKLTLTLSGVTDEAGNKSADVQYVIDIVDELKPIVSFVQDFSEKWDVNDWENRPIVSKTDVKYSTNSEEKTLTLDFSVTAPNGRVYTTGLLPFTQMGEYIIKYTVRDNFGNETILTRTLTVGDFTAPTIETKSTIIANVGDTVNLSAESVEDYVDGAIKNYSIAVYKDGVRVSSGKRFVAKDAGEYEVVYTARDKSDNEATETTRLIVKATAAETEKIGGCSSAMDGVVATVSVALILGVSILVRKRKGGAENE